MSILFGTDGIRGKVGIYPITPEFFFELGKVVAEVFKYYHAEGELPQFLIARDTRISTDMLETALISGFTSMGSDVITLGCIPTPALAYLTKELKVSAGLMITASHNPFIDNGIKIFDHMGYKVSDKIQDHIEKLLMTKATVGKVVDNNIYGRVTPNLDLKEKYLDLLKSYSVKESFQGLKLVLDCSNGVAGTIAPQLFKQLGATVQVVGNKPNGININKNVGATFPENLTKQVLKYKADIGVAFDGDADRVIFANSKGEILNGDKVLALTAIALKEQGLLHNDTLVLTQMSNLGIINSLKKYGISVVSTLVGDRYVMEEMRQGNYSLGGENSGHIIFADASSTGDGLLSAIKIINFIMSQEERAKEILDSLEVYPYDLLNLQVERKPPIETLPNVEKVLLKCEKDLGAEGRYLLRYSGTENKIRILIEAKSKDKVDKWVPKIAQVIRKDIG